MLVFNIEVNINLFKASLSANKIDKTISILVATLLYNSLILKDTKALIGYLLFYTSVIQLG